MEKIINGKRYNTETAILVGRWNNNLPHDDFEWCDESLYKKRGGEYFIYGEGGSMTRYSKSKSIVPLSFEQAESWAKRHLDSSTYENEFTLSDDNKQINLLIRAPKSIVDKFKRLMSQRSMTSGDLLAELIKNAETE